MTHIDRRHLGTPRTETFLDGESLVQRQAEDGSELHRIALGEVRRVRLAVEMAAQARQVVCRVTGPDGREIAFGSMRFVSPGVFEDVVESFQPLLRALHTGLMPHRERIEFLEGQSVAFMWAMFLLSGSIALLAAIFLIVLFFIQEQPMGLFLAPIAGIGIWLAGLFRPRKPALYDPAKYAGDLDQ
ncbi:hypothetical protein [Maricaulis sp.]|uniref:hypothetical protein n=1 Tax=Maricaulis sp. TaxID=1486257 RepID=UPI002606F502|nr:hypothetical protein [Maricaulis sp.]